MHDSRCLSNSASNQFVADTSSPSQRNQEVPTDALSVQPKAASAPSLVGQRKRSDSAERALRNVPVRDLILVLVQAGVRARTNSITGSIGLGLDEIAPQRTRRSRRASIQGCCDARHPWFPVDLGYALHVIRFVDCDRGVRLSDYESDLYLRPSVTALRQTAAKFLRIDGRRLFVINSTEHGGGVAEMLPSQVALLRDLGIDARWAVIEPEHPEPFFNLTKRLHNALHGQGRPRLTPDDRALFESESRAAMRSLAPHVRPGDLLIVHDPQPSGMGALLRRELRIQAVWRCHIGSDRRSEDCDEAWQFLKPWVSSYDRCVFSLPQYIPEFLRERGSIIAPAIDPLSHKNRELSVHKLTGILVNAQLALAQEPVLYPNFDFPARRFSPSGQFEPACSQGDLGLLFRPIVLQISRWDRLKGFAPLLEAFIELKRSAPPLTQVGAQPSAEARAQRRLSLVRLVMAGPDPRSIADDPEGRQVLTGLCDRWLQLDEELRRDIVIVSLPMQSRKYNALMVNALQRCSTIVLQNSLREGFGLTATEAMSKGAFVLASRAAGLRTQIDHGVHGELIDNPEDPSEIATALRSALSDPLTRMNLGRNARRRVAERYLLPVQLEHWIVLLSELLGESADLGKE